MVINLLIISLSAVALWLGALFVVESASRIARKLGLSELVIGLTIVAIATSAPEFAVTVLAAFRGQMEISVGNIVGSNIFNLGIILGIVAIFSAVKVSSKMLYRDGSLLILTGLLLLFFFFDLSLTFIEGIILLVILISYVIYLVRHKESLEEEVPAGEFRWFDIPLLLVGAVLIILGADYLVESASDIARLFGVSEWLIGITIVAMGTSIPELATSVVALAKNRLGISAGNLIGSDLFNMLGVLGVAALFRTLEISVTDYTSLIYLAINLVLVFYFMRTGWKISRTEGILLILIGLVRWGLVIFE